MSCEDRDRLHEEYLRAMTAYVRHQDKLRLPRVRNWAIEKKRSRELHEAYMDTMGAWLEHIVNHGCS